jgi:hypothetical protein
VPNGVVTETLPLAPAPTVANIAESDRTLIESAATPPNLTTVVPLKCDPKIVTVVPLWPLFGVKDLITGVSRTVESLIKVKPRFDAAPNGVITETLPLEPEPTIAHIVESLSVKNEAAVVTPKATIPVPVK